MGEIDLGIDSDDVTSLNSTTPSKVHSSTLNPLRTSVRSPFSSPRSPPRARNAAKLLGLRSLLSWPGEKANLLLSTSNSSSRPGSGVRASSSSMLVFLVTSEWDPCEAVGT